MVLCVVQLGTIVKRLRFMWCCGETYIVVTSLSVVTTDRVASGDKEIVRAMEL